MKIDYTTNEWLNLEKWVTQEIATLRERNDALGLTADETAALRGEIRAYKKILSLRQDAAREVEPLPPYFPDAE